MKKNKKKVFIVNKSSHDFSKAKNFGELIFLSHGSMNRYQTNDIHRQFSEVMKDSKKDDYIVLCALSVMNVMACAIFVHKHKRLNILLYKNGNYLERNHVF